MVVIHCCHLLHGRCRRHLDAFYKFFIVHFPVAKELSDLLLLKLRPLHFEFFDNLEGFAHIQTQRLEVMVEEYLSLLLRLILGHQVQIGEALPQERSDVAHLQQDLRVVAELYVGDEVLKDLLYVFQLLCIGEDQVLLVKEALLFLLVLPR